MSVDETGVGGRRRRARTPRGIPFATISALIAVMHGLGERDRIALRSRLHHFRRLNFPDGVAIGSGRHFAYGASDVVGLAVAFELVDAHLPPVAAADLVRSGWPEIARAATDGRDPAGPPSYVTFHMHALRPIGTLPAGGRSRQKTHVELEVLAGSRCPGATISLDVASTTRMALRQIAKLDRRSSEIMELEMATLANRFGYGPALPRNDAVGDRLGGDGPLWERAADLLTEAPAADPRDARRLRWSLDYILKPAPVDAWKTRVEVLPDVGFAAAMAWYCKAEGLVAARTALPADALELVGERLLSAYKSNEGVAARLIAIIAAASDHASGSGGG